MPDEADPQNVNLDDVLAKTKSDPTTVNLDDVLSKTGAPDPHTVNLDHVLKTATAPSGMRQADVGNLDQREVGGVESVGEKPGSVIGEIGGSLLRPVATFLQNVTANFADKPENLVGMSRPPGETPDQLRSEVRKAPYSAAAQALLIAPLKSAFPYLHGEAGNIPKINENLTAMGAPGFGEIETKPHYYQAAPEITPEMMGLMMSNPHKYLYEGLPAWLQGVDSDPQHDYKTLAGQTYLRDFPLQRLQHEAARGEPTALARLTQLYRDSIGQPTAVPPEETQVDFQELGRHALQGTRDLAEQTAIDPLTYLHLGPLPAGLKKMQAARDFVREAPLGADAAARAYVREGGGIPKSVDVPQLARDLAAEKYQATTGQPLPTEMLYGADSAKAAENFVKPSVESQIAAGEYGATVKIPFGPKLAELPIPPSLAALARPLGWLDTSIPSFFKAPSAKTPLAIISRQKEASAQAAYNRFVVEQVRPVRDYLQQKGIEGPMFDDVGKVAEMMRDGTLRGMDELSPEMEAAGGKVSTNESTFGELAQRVQDHVADSELMMNEARTGGGENFKQYQTALENMSTWTGEQRAAGLYGASKLGEFAKDSRALFKQRTGHSLPELNADVLAAPGKILDRMDKLQKLMDDAKGENDTEPEVTSSVKPPPQKAPIAGAQLNITAQAAAILDAINEYAKYNFAHDYTPAEWELQHERQNIASSLRRHVTELDEYVLPHEYKTLKEWAKDYVNEGMLHERDAINEASEQHIADALHDAQARRGRSFSMDEKDEFISQEREAFDKKYYDAEKRRAGVAYIEELNRSATPITDAPKEPLTTTVAERTVKPEQGDKLQALKDEYKQLRDEQLPEALTKHAAVPAYIPGVVGGGAREALRGSIQPSGEVPGTNTLSNVRVGADPESAERSLVHGDEWGQARFKGVKAGVYQHEAKIAKVGSTATEGNPTADWLKNMDVGGPDKGLTGFAWKYLTPLGLKRMVEEFKLTAPNAGIFERDPFKAWEKRLQYDLPRADTNINIEKAFRTIYDTVPVRAVSAWQKIAQGVVDNAAPSTDLVPLHPSEIKDAMDAATGKAAMPGKTEPYPNAGFHYATDSEKAAGLARTPSMEEIQQAFEHQGGRGAFDDYVADGVKGGLKKAIDSGDLAAVKEMLGRTEPVNRTAISLNDEPVYIHGKVAREYEAYKKVGSDPYETMRWLRGAAPAVIYLTGQWKKYATFAGPQFLAYNIRNQMHDTTRAYLSGLGGSSDLIPKLFEPTRQYELTRDARVMNGVNIQIGDRIVNGEQFMRMAEDAGFLHHGMENVDITPAPENALASAAGKVSKAIDDTAQQVMSFQRARENASRLAAFADALRQGDSLGEAGMRVNEAFFDYKRLAPIANVARLTGVVPFAAWTSKSIPFTMNWAFHNPGEFMAVTRAMDMMRQGALTPDQLPDYMKNKHNIVVNMRRDKDGDHYEVLSNSKLFPPTDVTELANAVTAPDGSPLAYVREQMGPVIGALWNAKEMSSKGEKYTGGDIAKTAAEGLIGRPADTFKKLYAGAVGEVDDKTQERRSFGQELLNIGLNPVHKTDINISKSNQISLKSTKREFLSSAIELNRTKSALDEAQAQMQAAEVQKNNTELFVNVPNANVTQHDVDVLTAKANAAQAYFQRAKAAFERSKQNTERNRKMFETIKLAN